MSSSQHKRLDFEEFCAAAISIHQLKSNESWEIHVRNAYDLFEEYGNRPIMIEELASVCSLSHSKSFFFFSLVNKLSVTVRTIDL